jgi:hypothetical protein
MDEIAFHHIKCGASDSIRFIFDETKADKTGEFVQDKNCYANLFKPSMCFPLSLACWICLCAEKLEKLCFCL